MKIKKITFFTELKDINDIYDDNIDVLVKSTDGKKYVVVVATQKNLLTLMRNEQNEFLSPGDPMIIVSKLNRQIIESAIQAYAENNGYYLKFYAANLDVKTLDVLKDREIARDKLIDDLLEKHESIDIKNYDLIDFDIDKL